MVIPNCFYIQSPVHSKKREKKYNQEVLILLIKKKEFTGNIVWKVISFFVNKRNSFSFGFILFCEPFNDASLIQW